METLAPGTRITVHSDVRLLTSQGVIGGAKGAIVGAPDGEYYPVQLDAPHPRAAVWLESSRFTAGEPAPAPAPAPAPEAPPAAPTDPQPPEAAPAPIPPPEGEPAPAEAPPSEEPAAPAEPEAPGPDEPGAPAEAEAQGPEPGEDGEPQAEAKPRKKKRWE